jgi:hypothetical protein
MKSLRIYLISGAIILTLYVIAQANRPKAVNWTETLSCNEKAPYGTYILFNRLNDIFPDAHINPYHQPVYNVIAEDSIANASYVIIAPSIDFSKTDDEQIIKYVKAGNDVFIGAEYFGRSFEKDLNVRTTEYFKIISENNSVHFVSPFLDSQKYFTLDKSVGSVYFSQFDTAKMIVLGENSQHNVNFLKYNIGKGSLYLMSNPKFFSNYSLLKAPGSAYAATALSFVKNTRQLIWDEYYTQGDDADDSPMRVFLNSDALRWAYYITLSALLIFLLFEIKRRQRIIPLIEPLRNSTLEFVTVVGQLYYEKRNNANIAHKKITYLLAHLRDEYHLKTNKLDDEFIEKLTAKLGVDVSFATKLVNYLQSLTAKTYVSDRELIELNKMIEKLYTQSA